MQRYGTLCVAAVAAIASLAHAGERPNIVVILSDDMGYSDIGCYGGEIETPTLDALAARGVRFSQFYNTGRCCPTRACLLTGLYPHQAGVGFMMGNQNLPGYRGDLQRNCVTIAQVLKSAGYATYMAGKWHVTPHRGPFADNDKKNWPRQRGFDRFYGTIHGGGSFFDPNTLVRDNTFISPYADAEYQPPTYYYTDAISDHATRYVCDHAEQAPDEGDQRPFFLYIAYTAAHWPMHALPEDIAKYDGRYDDGYGPIRAARLKRLHSLGLIDQKWRFAPQPIDWKSVKNREWESRCMEVYAAMVDRMDQGIGRLVAALKKTGQFDNTLILYVQDNGGCAETIGRRPGRYSSVKELDVPKIVPMADAALQPDMIPRRARDGRPVLMGDEVMPGGPDTFHAYGEGWANVSNTPFRLYKSWNHEGGVATPLIMSWPRGIAEPRGGAIYRQPAHLIDIMATCVDIAGAEYPAEVGGSGITPMEGVPLSPALRGEPLARTNPIFFEHRGNRAIRDGRWKLVANGARGPWELYDMEADRAELNDLAKVHLDRAQSLADQWEAWAKRANAKPWPWGKR